MLHAAGRRIPTQGYEGTPAGAGGVRTVTVQMAAREKADDQLRELTESLEAQVRARTEQLQAISQRVVEIQETERHNLAAELHDRLGQDLAAISLNLHIIKDQLAAGLLTKVGPRLDDSIALVDRTVEVVRDVAGTLRPLMLDDYGLAATLRSYGEQFAARTGIRVTVTAKQPVPRLQREAEMALFRVSQEALTNVLKHAKAAVVRLTLAVDAENVSLTMADDGCGFDAESAMDHRTRGLGLLIMQERLRAVDGSLRIESRPGAGRVRNGHLVSPGRRDRPSVTSHTQRELTLDNFERTGVRSPPGWSREFHAWTRD